MYNKNYVTVKATKEGFTLSEYVSATVNSKTITLEELASNKYCQGEKQRDELKRTPAEISSLILSMVTGRYMLPIVCQKINDKKYGVEEGNHRRIYIRKFFNNEVPVIINKKKFFFRDFTSLEQNRMKKQKIRIDIVDNMSAADLFIATNSGKPCNKMEQMKIAFEETKAWMLSQAIIDDAADEDSKVFGLNELIGSVGANPNNRYIMNQSILQVAGYMHYIDSVSTCNYEIQKTAASQYFLEDSLNGMTKTKYDKMYKNLTTLCSCMIIGDFVSMTNKIIEKNSKAMVFTDIAIVLYNIANSLDPKESRAFYKKIKTVSFKKAYRDEVTSNKESLAAKFGSGRTCHEQMKLFDTIIRKAAGLM